MRRLLLTVAFSAGVLGLTACSDAEPAASTSYCATALEAVNGRINFTDTAMFERLVTDPALPDRYRAEMTAAAVRARQLWANASAWSNDDMVAVVNSMCGVDLTPVTMQP